MRSARSTLPDVLLMNDYLPKHVVSASQMLSCIVTLRPHPVMELMLMLMIVMAMSICISFPLLASYWETVWKQRVLVSALNNQ